LLIFNKTLKIPPYLTLFVRQW